MPVRYFLSVTLTAFSLLHLSSCAHKSAQTQQPKEQKYIGNYYAALEFEPGKSSLSNINKSHLNLLAQKALRDGREVGEIKILAWSDKEYPSEFEHVSPKDKILAKERGRNIEKYLKEELYATDPIDVFNMAKSPDSSGRLQRMKTGKLKRLFKIVEQQELNFRMVLSPILKLLWPRHNRL